MATVKFSGYVWAKKESWQTKHSFSWFEGDGSSEWLLSQGHLPVGPVDFSFEMPESFNPITAEVEALNQTKKALEIAFHKRVSEINDRISNLQCLEFNPTETAVSDEIPF